MLQAKQKPARVVFETWWVNVEGRGGWAVDVFTDCFDQRDHRMQPKLWASHYRFQGKEFDVTVCSRDSLSYDRALRLATRMVNRECVLLRQVIREEMSKI